MNGLAPQPRVRRRKGAPVKELELDQNDWVVRQAQALLPRVVHTYSLSHSYLSSSCVK